VLPDDTLKIYEKCGTPCYVAPEILRGVGYNTKCDIFSMGSLLFNMLTGRFLFKGKDKMEILHHNKQCNLSLIDDYLESVSITGRNILK
jgi:serine/threonine protein kinase